jgi:hypothetical protein
MGAGRAQQGCGSASGACRSRDPTGARFAQPAGRGAGAREGAFTPATSLTSWPHSSTPDLDTAELGAAMPGTKNHRNWSMDNLAQLAADDVFWDDIPKPPPRRVVGALPGLAPQVLPPAASAREQQRLLPTSPNASEASRGGTGMVQRFGSVRPAEHPNMRRKDECRAEE